MSKANEFGLSHGSAGPPRDCHPRRRVVRGVRLREVLQDLQSPILDRDCLGTHPRRMLLPESAGIGVDHYRSEALSRARLGSMDYDAAVDDFAPTTNPVNRIGVLLWPHFLDQVGLADHVPCLVPATVPGNLRRQWEGGWFSSRQMRSALRFRRLAVMRETLSSTLPSEVLIRPQILGAYLLGCIGIDRFEHVIRGKRPFLAACRASAAMPSARAPVVLEPSVLQEASR